MSNQLNVNMKLRTDDTPYQLLINLLVSPVSLRLLGILFAIIVFGCVSDQVSNEFCSGYNNSDACSFAVAVGVIAFLLCLVLLLKDVIILIVDFSEAIKIKLALALFDCIISAFWAFMWFVCFCFTANQRSQVHFSNRALRNCANSGITFSFFSIIVWVALVVYNAIVLVRILKGSDRDSSGGGEGGYSSFPENQQPASGAGYDEQRGAPYNPPEY